MQKGICALGISTTYLQQTRQFANKKLNTLTNKFSRVTHRIHIHAETWAKPPSFSVFTINNNSEKTQFLSLIRPMLANHSNIWLINLYPSFALWQSFTTFFGIFSAFVGFVLRFVTEKIKQQHSRYCADADVWVSTRSLNFVMQCTKFRDSSDRYANKWNPKC